MPRLQEPTASRSGFRVAVDATLAAATRAAAADRGIQIWRVLEDAFELGLHFLPPVDEALPEYAYAHTKVRGRETIALFAKIAPASADAVRAAAAARRAHVWWVTEEALRFGLPLLPEPTRVPTLDDEELRQSA